jgi:hypothetical protein
VLAGTWRLEYTTAADVLVILEAERRAPFGLLRFGDIYQSFDAWGNMCVARAVHLRCVGARVRVCARGFVR